MRVPWPIVLLLCVVVPGGVWWYGARGRDFVTPPTEERLTELRREAGEVVPAPVEKPIEKPAATEPAPPPPVEPPIETGDLVTLPALNAYAAEARTKGADHLLKLAAKLEEKGAAPRALLAYERVLDLGKADTIQSGEAVKGIKRLRPSVPPWNVDPEGAIPLVLHLGTSPAMAEKLKPVLASVPAVIARASGGIVAVTTNLAVGKKPSGGAETMPVALWLSGGPNEAPSTEVLSFTAATPDALEKQVLGTVFELVRARLSRGSTFGPPLPLGPNESPAEGLESHITRLCWQEFAKGLNVVPPAAAVAPPATPAKPPVGKPAAKPAKPSTKPAAAKPPVAKPAVKPKPKPKPVRDADQE